jgi:hypothetical protein
MKRTSFSTRALIGAALAACLASAGCTMKNQEAPPLTGPSEYGTAITITVSPDVLTQDGASQSLVTITVRDQNGNPLRNQSLRAEIFVDGTRVDFGSLSARNLVSDDNGKATLVFTAPSSPSGPSVDSGTVVQIVVTPVGNDFGNTFARRASIRLVPPGVVVPADGLAPSFVPLDGATFPDQSIVFFDASASTSNPNNPIVSYSWDFGDGQTGNGRTTTHTYGRAGSYSVRLTIGDAFGRTASTTHVIILGQGAAPTASFSVSPKDPTPNQSVSFNASTSTAAPGHSIVSYTWDFGDGSPIVVTSSPQVTKPLRGPGAPGYGQIGTYTVTLIVTDETGKTGVITQSVAVAFPDAGIKPKGAVIK